jgi:hydroxypyruvate isomerase
MYRLSVCAGTVLQDVPFAQRVKEIARAGFLVDFWGWEEGAIDTIAADPAIEIGAIPGWIGGSMVHPDGVESYLEGVRTDLRVAQRLNCRNLCITTGALDERGQMAHPVAEHPATRWITAYKTLCQVAELAERHGVVYHLEQLNTKVDHAGYPFPHFQTQRT